MNIKSITLENIYKSPEDFATNLKLLEWFPEHAGEVLKDFKSLPEPVKEMLNSFNPGIVVDEEKSGTFRKPFNTVRFEDFYEGTVLVGLLAIEPITVEFMKYIGSQELKGPGTSVFGINFSIETLIDEYILPVWEVYDTIKIHPGELYFFSPDKFHRIDGSPIMQVFYLNRSKFLDTVEDEAKQDV